MKYFEKRFDGSRTFELDGSRLHIKGSNSLRSDFELAVDLTTVSPEYSLLRLRHRLFFIALFLLIVLAVIGVATDKILIMSGGIVLALVLMTLGLKKQTFYQFNYRTGGVAFDVCEAGPEKARAVEFVRALAAAIAASAPRPTEG
jgi:hypothetical protein